ncbi:MAG: hypothetical protein J1F01_02305 [Oscillospiraceae bacterium]|nr:hypothetical protein [Oscillospiraceae bacterium]
MKKRKFLALILSAAMTLAVLPAAAQPDSEHTAYETLSTSDDLSYEAETNDLQIHHEKLEERMHKYAAFSETDINSISLMAADTTTLSGTVSLPNKANTSSDSRVFISLYEIDITPEGKILHISDSPASSGYADFTKGGNAAKYSVTVPKGTYIASVDVYEISNTAHEYFYYREDGEFTDNMYFATPLNLTANKNINITLESMERMISGTVTFTEPAQEDTWFYINAYSTGYDDDYYYSTQIKKGQTSLNYAIGVGKDVYYLEISDSNGDYRYYSISGVTTMKYENRYFIDTTHEGRDNIDFSFKLYDDSENTGSGGGIGVVSHSVPVTITLPEPASERTAYRITSGYIYNKDRPNALHYFRQYSSTYLYANAGSRTVSGSVRIPSHEDTFIIRVVESTENSTQYFYYHDENGVTSSLYNATDIDSYQSEPINIVMPDALISGTVSRNGLMEGEYLTAIVSAFSNDGEERFFAPVLIPADNDSAKYELRIPSALANQDCAVEAELYYNSYDSFYMEYEKDDYIGFTGIKDTAVPITSASSSGINFTLPQSDMICHLEGTVVLSEPAPKGGLLLQFNSSFYTDDNYHYYTTPYYIIPEGEKNIDVDTYIITNSAGRVYADLTDINHHSDYSDIDINDTSEMSIEWNGSNFDDYVEVSGKVILPNGATKYNAVSYQINLDGYEYYGTVAKGETEDRYSIMAYPDSFIDEATIRILASGAAPILADELMYYHADGTTDYYYDYYGLDIYVEPEMQDINFTVPECTQTVTGNIVLPEGVSNNDVTIRVQVSSADDWEINSAYIDLTGKTTPYCVAIPDDEDSESVIVKYNVEYGDGLYEYELYYSEDEALCWSDIVDNGYEYPLIPLTESGASNINLTLAGYKITVNLTGHRAPLSDPSAWLDTYIYLYPDISEIPSINAYIDISPYDSEDHTQIAIPDISIYRDIQSFKLSYSIFDGNCQYDDLYINPDGTYTFDADKAYVYSVNDSKLDIDFTIVDNSYFTSDSIDKGELEFSVDEAVMNTDDGIINASVRYTNNSDMMYVITAILCAYNNDGNFASVSYDTIRLDSTSGDEVTDTVSFDVDSDEYTYKLLLWNNMDLMKPLSPPVPITIAE